MEEEEEEEEEEEVEEDGIGGGLAVVTVGTSGVIALVPEVGAGSSSGGGGSGGDCILSHLDTLPGGCEVRPFIGGAGRMMLVGASLNGGCPSHVTRHTSHATRHTSHVSQCFQATPSPPPPPPFTPASNSPLAMARKCHATRCTMPWRPRASN